MGPRVRPQPPPPGQPRGPIGAFWGGHWHNLCLIFSDMFFLVCNRFFLQESPRIVRVLGSRAFHRPVQKTCSNDPGSLGDPFGDLRCTCPPCGLWGSIALARKKRALLITGSGPLGFLWAHRTHGLRGPGTPGDPYGPKGGGAAECREVTFSSPQP